MRLRKLGQTKMRKDYFEITYRLRIRIVFITVLSVLMILFYIFPKIVEANIIFEKEEYTEILNVQIIKPIQQEQQFKSARPSIPIEADDESEIDTIDFMDTDIAGFGDWGTPAPNQNAKRAKWVKYDSPPTPKKSLNPKYPAICKQAGVEGRVTIGFWVDKNGVVDLASVEVLESIPCLDQVCLNTIRKSKWRPAQQGRKKVGVPMTKSFKFTLN